MVLLCTQALAQPAPPADLKSLISELQRLVSTSDRAAYLELLLPGANREEAELFAVDNVPSEPGRAVVTELDRRVLSGAPAGEGFRLMIEVFHEASNRGRVATWRLDVRKHRSEGEERWRIAAQERLTLFDGLYRLTLNPAKQYSVRNAVVTSEDLELKLVDGTAFVAETSDGASAVVFLGRGDMTFHPTPLTEREQVKIFSGDEALRSPFSSVFLRVNPGAIDADLDLSTFVESPVDPAALRKATEIFEEFIGKSYHVDLRDLSSDLWSLVPGFGDFLADVKTRRFETITYARSSGEPEDVNVFDRKRKRNIAIYASQQKLAFRGRFYDEDSLAAYDVVDYEIDATLSPLREFIDGRTLMRLQVKSVSLATLTIKLAERLAVRSVFSDRFGRLLHLRAVGQDSLLISLPTALRQGSYLTLIIEYSGDLPSQELEREAVELEQRPAFAGQDATVPKEPSYLYSSRSFWYAQSTTTDYATAVLRLTVPGDFAAVASGDAVSVATVAPDRVGAPISRMFTFEASQPLRYLAVVVSRFVPAQVTEIEAAPDNAGSEGELVDGPASDRVRQPGVDYDRLLMSISANPRQVGRGQEILDRAAAIASFYHSIIGDFPYPSFTISLVESDLPGGHSPGYFALLNQPLPATPFGWRNDPVSFDSFPQFFLAHEIAHQWWGQAIGWKNYHEQWMSEGFAQYFALLYARELKGAEGFNSLMRQVRRSAMDYSPQGAVHLGYRLGHVKSDSKIFRAIVYNKGAAVLHMLRRLVGDETFFRGLRRFYEGARFQKVGADDFRVAMEVESKRSLERFFERWIYNAALPQLRFSYSLGTRAAATNDDQAAAGQSAATQEITLKFEQAGEVFDVPVTVTLNMASGPPVEVVVPVTDAVTEWRLPITGAVRSVDVNRDNAALAEISRR